MIPPSPSDTAAGLQVRVALLTGAGRGIGQAIAIALGDAGLSVTLSARSEEQLAETACQIAGRQGHCWELPSDVCNRGQVEGMRTVVRTMRYSDRR